MNQKKQSGKNEEANPQNREVYCARLGHFVPLRYCLKPAQEKPCFKIKDCWWQTFDIVSYLESTLDPEDFHRLMTDASPTPNRISTILGVIEDIKKRGESE